MMPLICCAPSPALLARSEASLLSPIRLPIWPSRSRMVSKICCVAWRVPSARLFTSLATTAKPRPAVPARAASIVALSASRLVCFAIASIEPETFATCDRAEPTALSRASMRPTRFDEFGDVLDGRIHRAARLNDLYDGCGRGRLHRLRCIGDLAVGRDHCLGRLLQVVEPLRLVGDAACDLLDVAGDIGKLHAEPADAVGKLVNESFGQRLVGLSVQDGTLHNGHVRAFSS